MIVTNIFSFAAFYGRYYSNNHQNLMHIFNRYSLLFTLAIKQNLGAAEQEPTLKRRGKAKRNKNNRTSSMIYDLKILSTTWKTRFLLIDLLVLEFFYPETSISWTLWEMLCTVYCLAKEKTRCLASPMVCFAREIKFIQRNLYFLYVLAKLEYIDIKSKNLCNLNLVICSVIEEYKRDKHLFNKLTVMISKLLITCLIVYSLYILFANNDLPDLLSFFILFNTSLVVYIMFTNNTVVNRSNFLTSFFYMLKNPFFIVHALLLNLLFFYPRNFFISSTYCDSYEILFIIFIIGVNFMNIPPLIRTIVIIFNEILKVVALNFCEGMIGELSIKIKNIYFDNCYKSITVRNIFLMAFFITIIRLLLWNLEYIPFINQILNYENIKYYIYICCDHTPESIARLKSFFIIQTIVYIGGSGYNSYSSSANNFNPGGSGGPGGPSPNDFGLGLGRPDSNTDASEDQTYSSGKPLETCINPTTGKHKESVEYCSLAQTYIKETALISNMTPENLTIQLNRKNITCNDLCKPRDIINGALLTKTNPYNHIYKNPDLNIQNLVYTMRCAINHHLFTDRPKIYFKRNAVSSVGHEVGQVTFKIINSYLSPFQIELLKYCTRANSTHYQVINKRESRTLDGGFADSCLIFNSSKSAYYFLNVLNSLGLKCYDNRPNYIDLGMALPESTDFDPDKSLFASSNKSKEILEDLQYKYPDIDVNAPQDPKAFAAAQETDALIAALCSKPDVEPDSSVDGASSPAFSIDTAVERRIDEAVERFWETEYPPVNELIGRDTEILPVNETIGRERETETLPVNETIERETEVIFNPELIRRCINDAEKLFWETNNLEGLSGTEEQDDYAPASNASLDDSFKYWYIPGLPDIDTILDQEERITNSNVLQNNNPIQANPIQANPIETNPIEANYSNIENNTTTLPRFDYFEPDLFSATLHTDFISSEGEKGNVTYNENPNYNIDYNTNSTVEDNSLESYPLRDELIGEALQNNNESLIPQNLNDESYTVSVQNRMQNPNMFVFGQNNNFSFGQNNSFVSQSMGLQNNMVRSGQNIPFVSRQDSNLQNNDSVLRQIYNLSPLATNFNLNTSTNGYNTNTSRRIGGFSNFGENTNTFSAPDQSNTNIYSASNYTYDINTDNASNYTYDTNTYNANTYNASDYDNNTYNANTYISPDYNYNAYNANTYNANTYNTNTYNTNNYNVGTGEASYTEPLIDNNTDNTVLRPNSRKRTLDTNHYANNQNNSKKR